LELEMRIGIDARFLGVANSNLAKYSENLLLALSRRDEKNQYVVFVHGNLARKLKLGANFRLAPLRGRPLGLGAMARLSAALRREQLDVLHVHFPLMPLFFRRPTFITVHDMLPFARDHGDFGTRLRPWRWLWTYLLYPVSIQKAKWIICVSHATRRNLSNLFPDAFHKSAVVHSGVNEKFSAPIESATRELIRAHLELPERYLIYSGSTRPDKNLAGLLGLFALLRERHPDLEDLHLVLELAGDESLGPPPEKLIQARRLEAVVRIVRHAREEERRVLLEDARALVLLSRNEGFGFPVIEAQLCGLPVMVADSGALPEIAGEGAVLVDPDNLETAASLLGRLVSDETLRAWLIEKGRANAKRFDWNRAAEQLVQMFELLT
jgi:glycosyltransferase involved in cell wall biosynthesis